MANLENSTIRNRLHIIKDANLDGNLNSRFEEILMGYQLYNISKLLSDNIIYGDNYANSVTLTGDHTEILARRIKRNDGNILISAQTGLTVEAQDASISRTAKKHITDTATDEYYALSAGTYISETAGSTVDIIANSTNTGITTAGTGNYAMKLQSKGSMYINASNDNADVVVVAKRHILAKAGTNINLEAAAGSYTLRAQTNISETATTGSITRTATAGSITDTAKNNYSLTATSGSITESAGTTVGITGGTGISETATTGNITRTATAGAINDTAGTSVTIKANNGTLQLNSVAKDVNIQAKTNLTEKADGNYSLTVAGTTTVSSTGNVSISSTGNNTDVTITAKRNMLLQAQNGTNTLKGYSTVKVESTNADLDIDSKTSTVIDAGTSFSLKANNGTGLVQSTSDLTIKSTTASITENATTTISRTAGTGINDTATTGNISRTASTGSINDIAATTITIKTVDGKLKLESSNKDIDIYAKTNITEKADGNYTLTVAGATTISSTGNYFVDAREASADISANTIKLASSTGNIELFASGNNSKLSLKAKNDVNIESENGNVNIKASYTNKYINLTGNTNISESLSVTRNTSIGGALEVTSDSQFNGAVTIGTSSNNKDLRVYGSIYKNTSLVLCTNDFNGDNSSYYAPTVAGTAGNILYSTANTPAWSSAIDCTATYINNIKIGGANKGIYNGLMLTSNIPSTLSNDATFSIPGISIGSATNTSYVNITDDLKVVQTAIFYSKATFKDSIDAKDNINVDGESTFNDYAEFQNARFKSAVTIDGSATLKGNTICNGTLSTKEIILAYGKTYGSESVRSTNYPNPSTGQLWFIPL